MKKHLLIRLSFSFVYEFFCCLIIMLLIFFVINNVYANHRGGLHLQLQDTTIDLNINDVEQYEIATISPGYDAILLKLTPQFATRLHQLTEKAVGQSISWIWNGRVLSFEKIKSPIERDLTLFNFTSQEAEDFRKYFKSK